MRNARSFPVGSWNSSAFSPTTPAAHPARSTRTALRTLVSSEAFGASRISKGFRCEGSSENASARSTASANASGVGDGALATDPTALPLTNQMASFSAFASSETARFGSEGRSSWIPSVSSKSETSESGLANTRRFPIRRRSSAMDKASSRSSGNLIARSNGSPSRSPIGRSCRLESSISARRSRERRNCFDSPSTSSRRPKASSARSSRSWSSSAVGSDPPRRCPKGTGNNPSPITLSASAASSATACWLSTGVSTCHTFGSVPHRSRHASRNSSRESREAERRVV